MAFVNKVSKIRSLFEIGDRESDIDDRKKKRHKN